MSLALADELFLMTHDLQSGRARVAAPTLGVGLAAALLGELLFSGCLVTGQGLLGPGAYGPPADRLVEAVFHQTRTQLLQREVTLRDWLGGHRRIVLDLVADRMIRAGELRREEHRRLGRVSVRYYPQQPAEAFIRAQRLPAYLRNRVEVTLPDVVLGALLSLLAPSGALLEVNAAGREHLEQGVLTLPVPLRDLLDETKAFIVTVQRNPDA